MKPLNLPKTVGRYCTNYVDRRFSGSSSIRAGIKQVFGIPAFPALPNHGGGQDVVILTVKRNVSEYSGQYTCGFLSVQPSPRGMFVNSLLGAVGCNFYSWRQNCIFDPLVISAKTVCLEFATFDWPNFRLWGQASVEDPTLIFSISWKTTEHSADYRMVSKKTISGRGASGL